MGRPKKLVTDAENTEQEVENKEEKTFDTIAVGHVKLSNGDFHMIKVPINSHTLEVGEVQLGKKCRDVLEAKYEFKIEAAKSGLV
jgi:hypothetical protein